MRERVRRLPARNFIVRASVLLAGAGFILLGLVAVVLPGPFTIPPVLLGLAIWSLEFDFAKTLLARVKNAARAGRAKLTKRADTPA